MFHRVLKGSELISDGFPAMAYICALGNDDGGWWGWESLVFMADRELIGAGVNYDSRAA